MKVSILLLSVLLATTVSNDSKLTASDDYKEIDEGKPINIKVLSNDYGVKGNDIKLEIAEYPEQGNVSIEEDNTITYYPELNYAGLVLFKYKISNANGDSDIAIVELRIRSMNYMPYPLNDTVIVYHNQRKYINVLENDLDIYDAPITIAIVEDIQNGRANINSDNNIFAEFDEFFYGLDSCIYEVVDVDNDRGVAKIYYEVLPGENGLFVPQAFSPNGDNKNDTFFIPELAVKTDVKLQLYDAHGMLVFMTNDYKNDWAGYSNIGRLKGRKCIPGTYYYFIDVPGMKERVSGFIYLSY